MYRVLELNPQLMPFAGDIEMRMEWYRNTKKRLVGEEGRLYDFANAHHYYGFHHDKGCWYYREWAPAAHQLYLTGEFNNWNPTSHPLTRIDDENWEIRLEGDDALWEGCRVKTVVDANMTRTEHMPLYARRVVQEKKTVTWVTEVTDEQKVFEWTDAGFKGEKDLLIYEAHVGMAQEEERIGTYREFADLILPKVQKAGYNTIQLMAIMEHPYYGSFGYQVSNFFAASSWFGKPEDLKYLVNKAHEMGIRVLLDVVHSHAVKNTAEGINMFDGTVWQFFHDGEKGEHPAWGTKCFDYGKTGVLHFLLSNLKFWMEEYHFDGFRFDGVTSMLYHDHGLGVAFEDSKYFSMNTHIEAVTYLQLANELIREVNPDAITIAEDMSGMPGMALPVADGGLGFDYRLGMGLPDLWIKMVKESADEGWSVGRIWGEMCLRRPGENTIAYVESHDQALVGDQTMIFRLAGADMYTDMNNACHTPRIDRAIALHKMLRMMTAAAGGEGYLNFMGNEFGHPEWIDFPREGNGWSFYYCRRQWSLQENGFLKYKGLGEFDRDMTALIREKALYTQRMPDLKLMHEEEQVIVFYRHGLMFAFNFNPWKTYNAWVNIPVRANYTVALSSDDLQYGGEGRVKHEMLRAKGSQGEYHFDLTIPPRTVIVLKEGKPMASASGEKKPAEKKTAVKKAAEPKEKKNAKSRKTEE